MNLLQINIRLWQAIREYCRKNRIDLPESEDSRKMDYYLYQLHGMIEEINGSPTKMKHFGETTKDDTEPIDRYYLKGPSSIFHTGAGLAIVCLNFGFPVFQ